MSYHHTTNRVATDVMTARVRLAVAIICILLGSGCFHVQTIDKPMKSWTGQPADKVIESWGAPDNESTSSDGRRVLTWIDPWVSSHRDMATDATVVAASGTCRRSVTLNQEGIVEQWRYSGCQNGWRELK